jgi:ComF family protein
VPNLQVAIARDALARTGRRLAALARAAARLAAPVGDALLDLLYPPRCAACGEPAPDGAAPFCPTCADAVEPVPPGCGRCGLPGPDPVCGACHAAPPAFAAVAAGGLYGGPLADAVRALKYGGRPAVARPLGRWLAARVPLPPGARVVALPLARGRRIARGYDQAARLAAHLARAAGRPLLAGALRRVRETPPQVGRSRAGRVRNVAGAFAAGPRPVAGLDVVLVDDVVTTGATADAAAAALLAAGARSVTVVALARAE